jgi:hypothetical protein
MERLSLNCPNRYGSLVMMTTAFCTVDLVMSADLRLSLLALSCRVQEIPNSDVAGRVSVAVCLKVK